MHLQPSLRLALALLTASACARSDEGSSTFSGGPGPHVDDSTSTGAGSSDTSSSTSTTGSSTTSSDLSTGGAAGSTGTFDVGVPPDFEPGPVGCQGKIDFLFVISGNKWTSTYQDRLIAAFPAFFDIIATEFAGFDAHILVAGSEPGWGAYGCQDCLWCSGCTCDENGGPDYPCGAGPKLSECDTTFGSGIVFPAGLGATNHPCELGGGHRYISAATPDPAGAFECVARLGNNGGDVTFAVDAMFAALGDGINSPFGCNAGFLRDDALLVVALIDATGDLWSDGWPFTWNWTLSDRKNYDPDAFVVLTMQADTYLPDGICTPYNEGGQHRLHEFADAVAHGVKGSVCAPDYAPYFAETAALALEQCEQLVPG
jgi:hypothetical protein